MVLSTQSTCLVDRTLAYGPEGRGFETHQSQIFYAFYFIGTVLLGDAELFPDAFGETAGDDKGEKSTAEEEQDQGPEKARVVLFHKNLCKE